MLCVVRNGVLRPATSSEEFTAKLRKIDAKHYLSLIESFHRQINKAQEQLNSIAELCPHWWESSEEGKVLPGTRCEVCGALFPERTE